MVRRALSRWTIPTLLVVAACTGCNAIIGGGIAAVGITAAMVFRGCDDYVGVTVRREGRVVCDVEVVARTEAGREIDFSPCYAAYLPDGTWQVEATGPSGERATSTVDVEHPDSCEPSVHTVELTLPSSAPAGAAATGAPSPTNPPARQGPTAVAAPPIESDRAPPVAGDPSPSPDAGSAAPTAPSAAPQVAPRDP